ncbi:hypothetical protein QQZ08_007756 [Neonectria magnoliae]|uniref:Uncharacterized protein n=1 Tax=Neonectria magnoliae TaxID=2732573 RepID=A0ABR1HY55_9HYPO
MATSTALGPKLKPRWHPLPTYHLKALKGWMNDPCAPGYDATTGTYHIFYQWNPKSCDWGDICWGHFTSRDGVHWKHNGKTPALEPSFPYDKLGIFTGCMYSTGPRAEKDQLTVIYSSIEHLPIHWTLPYVRNCAGLALATSRDGGCTWEKSNQNPILKGEPEGIDVTGFRDPYLSEWPAMDVMRGEKGKMLYGIVSGGIVDQGPNAFVYAVNANDLTTWTYLGPLVDMPVDFQRPSHWSGDFGLNWECVNFMTLGDGSDEYDFLILGSEGGLKKGVQEGTEAATDAWALWMAGSLRQTSPGGGIVLDHDFSGILDHGNLYAPNSYRHPHSGARIVWGWIKEEELPLSTCESKGWKGYLSLPRELFLLRLSNVVRALKTPLSEIPSVKLSNDERVKGRTKIIQTLGIRPLPNLKTLRRSEPMVWSKIDDLEIRKACRLHSTTSANWELEAVVKVQPNTQRIGFHIRHNDDLSQRTSIFFSVDEEEIIVDRSQSNDEPEIRKDNLSGPFTLFVHDDGDAEVAEDLHLRIFYDGDVLEIFANDRFSLCTVVYADTQTCTGISCFVDGDGDKNGRQDVGGFETIMLWESLGDAQTVANL